MSGWGRTRSPQAHPTDRDVTLAGVRTSTRQPAHTSCGTAATLPRRLTSDVLGRAAVLFPPLPPGRIGVSRRGKLNPAMHLFNYLIGAGEQ